MESKKNEFLLSVSQLFDSAWSTYKKHLLSILKINSIPSVIAVLVSSVLVFIKEVSESPLDHSFIFRLQLFAIACVATLVAVVIGSLSYIAQVKLISTNKFGSLKESFSNSIPYVYAYVVLMVCIGLSVLFGTVLLIVPGVIFAVWFMFAPLVLITSDTKGVKALKKSKSLVHGIWGPVFFRVIALMAFSLLLSIVSNVFIDFLEKLFSMNESNASMIVDLLYQLIVTPFAIVYMYELYKNLIHADTESNPICLSGGDDVVESTTS
jgi:hypothetical protein